MIIKSKKEQMLAQPLIYDTTVKINLSHNISSSKMLEVRFDLMQTVESVKENIEKRYGSDSNFMQLILKDKQGNVISHMSNDTKLLGSYEPQDGYEIHVIDTNPNSILKGLEDVGQVQKYKISDEEYDKLPNTMRKFKQQFINQQAAGGLEAPIIDDTFMENEALQINMGARCELNSNQARGTVRYIGQIPQMGLGYFIGVQLDEPVGVNNGTVKGYPYFHCPQKFGIFIRPNEITVGEYPELEIDEI